MCQNFKSRHLKLIYPFNIRNISGTHKNILLEYFMRISGPKERQTEPFYGLIFIQKKKLEKNQRHIIITHILRIEWRKQKKNDFYSF